MAEGAKSHESGLRSLIFGLLILCGSIYVVVKDQQQDNEILKVTNIVEELQKQLKQSKRRWNEDMHAQLIEQMSKDGNYSMEGMVVQSRRKREVGDESDKLLDLLLTIATFYKSRIAKKTFEHSCLNKTVICLPGKIGEKGSPGVVGPKGLKGIKGDDGEQGDTGKSGTIGPKGERGFNGPPGVKGDIGSQGPIGLPGMSGMKGEKGSPCRFIEKPKITSSPVGQTVTETGSVTFTCESTGKPEPEIKWYFHGRSVDKERYSYPVKTGLMIENVQFKDRGNVTCISHNMLGEVNATAELIVWVKPQITLSSRITIEEGKDANVSCQVKGYPKPRISWKRLVTTMPRNAEYNNEQSSMIIRNVGIINSGLYECAANNEAGSSKEMTLLVVLRDVNECLTSPCSCARNNSECESPCQNTIGSYTCSCNAGFELTNGGTVCADIDECSTNPCNHTCTNLPGSFACSCRRGFNKTKPNATSPECSDVNECLSNPCSCAPHNPGCKATCQNTAGSYGCSCNPGFKLLRSGGTVCVDVDECKSNPCSCASDTPGCDYKCENTVSSYKCSCNTGFNLIIGGKVCAAMMSSCKRIKSVRPIAPSGVYSINLGDESPGNAVQLYCDMETDGGGWTLVYSYGFTKYESFSSSSNDVTPIPNWSAGSAQEFISTSPPLQEYGRGALDFQLWKKIGREFMVKSNINHWIVCQPGSGSGSGSLVDWVGGSLTCKNIKNIGTTCTGRAPDQFYLGYSSYGPGLKRNGNWFYWFEANQGSYYPYHDRCGSSSTNHVYRISNPGGNIFIR